MKTKDLVYIAFFAALISVCAWISIPTLVPFTLQTFAVAAALLLLGGKKGTLAILVYLLLGAIGLPVFAGFKGGLDSLVDLTGGYKLGFLLMGLLYQLFEKRPKMTLPALFIGLITLYLFGAGWFMIAYTQSKGAVTLQQVLSWTLLPFILPDIVKILLAHLLSRRLSPLLQKLIA